MIRTQRALLVSLRKFRELHVLPFGLQVLKCIFGKTCRHNIYHMGIKGSAGHCAFLLAAYLWSSWSGIFVALPTTLHSLLDPQLPSAGASSWWVQLFWPARAAPLPTAGFVCPCASELGCTLLPHICVLAHLGCSRP